MKAIIADLQKQIDYSNEMDDPIDEVSWNYQYGVIISVNDAEKIINTLSSHMESELTSKIEKIKAEFSDECINEKLRTPDVKSGMIEMRDEILNRLK